MKYYLLEIKTNKNIGSEPFVHNLLTAWLTQLDQRLRPERFDLGEPVRRTFAEGTQKAVRLWVDNDIGLMLKRISKPKFVVNIHWRREKGLDTRPFPWGCTVWLQRAAGDVLAQELFRFLIRQFEPAFGFISTEEDNRDKHFISFTDRNEQVEMYVGTDVGDTLPGVYWITYFDPWAVGKIGKERFDELKAVKVESVDGGYLVWAYNSASDAGSALARESEARIISQLGKKQFFDKAKVDVEALKTRPEEAALVEEKIRELKAKKRGAK